MSNHGGGAEAHAYTANASLVLTTDSRPRDTHGPSGEPETLRGRMSFGVRAVQNRPPELQERLSKARTNKSRRRDDAADPDLPSRDATRRPWRRRRAQEVSVLSLTDDAVYKPQTEETRAAYEALLSLIHHQLGGQPPDVLAGAADKVLATLKNDRVRNPDKKKGIEQLLNPIASHLFDQLVFIGKLITDFHDASGAPSADAMDTTLDAAVEFDEDEDEESDFDQFDQDEGEESDFDQVQAEMDEDDEDDAAELYGPGGTTSTHNPPIRRHRDQGPLILNGGAAQQQQQQTATGSGGVNIQALVRCRPLSEEERFLGTPVVVTFSDERPEVSVTQNISTKQNVRTFAFDKVFGPESQQQDIFKHAVVPLVSEVLEGYNCTILTYGHTGTGKTFTMQGGGSKSLNGDLPFDAGVIQRAAKHIFDNLEGQSAQYNTKVSFLELYNEEVIDLLAPVDNKPKKPMILRDDNKGGFHVIDLVEELVSSAPEIYRTLERGSAKRKTAETLLNKQSSRSHSIFSITIHIKECTPVGEVMKCGKLNFVDLAGSENISRSGGDYLRALEARKINKSLLTLGRVITALVKHAGHIPYMDSKLTKLLKDSLGGKTKTCIIATIAPSVPYLEGTLNTLDYVYRARNIKNKPEVNRQINDKRKESNSASLRNAELMRLVVDYERRLREDLDSKQASEENLRMLSMEVSTLKNAKENLEKSEKRALDEVRDLTERVHCLQATIDTIHTTEEIQENARSIERRNHEEHIKRLERDWAELTKELQEQRDHVRVLSLDKKNVFDSCTKQVEDMRKELNDSLKAASDAESRATIAEAKCSDLEAIIMYLHSGIFEKDELFQLKEELEKYKEEAQANKNYMVQYKEIAHSNEVALKQLESAHQNYKAETEVGRKALEDEIVKLRDKLSEMEKSYVMKCEEEAANAIESKEKHVISLMDEISVLRTEVSQKQLQLEKLEIELASSKSSLDEQYKRWRTAQDNYERQVILQSETIQELTNTSRQLSSLQHEITVLRQTADALRTENDCLRSSVEQEKIVLLKEKDDALQKYNELNDQVFSDKEIENILLQIHNPDYALPSNVYAINIYKKEGFEDLKQYSTNGVACFVFCLEWNGNHFNRRMANRDHRWNQRKIYKREKLILKTMMYETKEERIMKHRLMKEYTMKEGPEDLVFCEILSDEWRDGG